MAKIDKIKEEGALLKIEVKKRMVNYITTALGLVAGLAWNEAIKGAIEYLFPLQKDTVLAKFLYAIIITFILVLITIALTKFFLDSEKKEIKKEAKEAVNIE
jgi:glycerol uptake facilitator-like aquaporin